MNIHYVSGSRADFGLMEATLQEIANTPNFSIQIIATGQHTADSYGNTIREIKASGLPLLHTIPVILTGDGGAEMAIALAKEIEGLVQLWQENRPDIVFLLGDRGEMLAAAIAASHLGIHIGHFHGGERSGTIDESLRHAISKISHYHFTATDDARLRLIKMGERPDAVWTVGAPGLVGILKDVESQEGWLQSYFGLKKPLVDILLVFHPVIHQADEAFTQIETITTALVDLGCGGIILRPNSDAGGGQIDKYLDTINTPEKFKVIDHLSRQEYRMVLSNVEILVGNTSSGIIESASFGIPFLNIGPRQQGRLQNVNVVECAEIEFDRIQKTFRHAQSLRGPFHNLYGDGNVTKRLLPLLRKLKLDKASLNKLNTY